MFCVIKNIWAVRMFEYIGFTNRNPPLKFNGEAFTFNTMQHWFREVKVGHYLILYIDVFYRDILFVFLTGFVL